MRWATNAELVYDMMERYEQETPDLPTPMSGAIKDLRVKLITEEFNEVMDSINNNEPMKNVAKELVDLLVVTYGTLIAMGVDANAAFREVHTSNLSKFGDDGKPIKNEFGKVIKSDNYVPADLTDLCTPCIQ
jgi:predicted HAD superfamily Cof-like phosphohydrolase